MRIRITIVVLVVVGSVCAGYWLQREVPSEKNRIRHPQAYSVCAPVGWSADMAYAPNGESLGNARRLDGISLSPDNFTGRRPKLLINRFASAPDADVLRADGWVDGAFQGERALLIRTKATKGLNRAALFERSGQWFEVVEGLPVPAIGEEEQWWAFLETFKYPDGEPAPVRGNRAVAASAPATSESFKFPEIGQ